MPYFKTTTNIPWQFFKTFSSVVKEKRIIWNNYSALPNWVIKKISFFSIPIVVPSGCAAYPNELITLPEIILWQRYKNLIHVSNPPRGGHFVALEEPEIFADDFLEFVRKSEALIL